MKAKTGAINAGINIAGEFTDDVGAFKIVKNARDPKSFPPARRPAANSVHDKKSKKKKDK